MKRTLLAIGAAAVLAAAVPTTASAQHRHGGHWGGGYWGGPGISFGLGVAPGPYYGYSDYGYADCYRFRRVRTPFGWESRRVRVC